MATIREIIGRVDENKFNEYSEQLKLRWVAILDGKIAVDVLLMHPSETNQFNYAYPEGMDTEPLVAFPHDDIYDLWLEAQIDMKNGEYEKYQNAMLQFNAAYDNFVNWFLTRHGPEAALGTDVNGMGGGPFYYITAYGLAVRQGFEGTLDEWLESLVGEKGEPGKDGENVVLDASLSLPDRAADAAAVGAALETKQKVATYHYDGAPVVADVAAWLDTVLAVMPNHSAVTVSGDFFNGSHVAYGILYKNNNDWASLYTTSYTDDEWRMRKYEGVWIDPECINRTTQEKLDSLKTVFWATYGKTTGVEIYNAYTAGKLVMCNRGEVNYILSYCSGNEWEGEITGAECWFIPINVPVWSTSTGNVGALYLGIYDNWQTDSNGGILDYTVAQGTCTLYIYPPSLNQITGADTPVLFTWNYRKWASGIAECWGESEEIYLPMLTFNNIVNLEDFGSCAFPISFTEIPAVSCSFVTTGRGGAWGYAEFVSTTGVGSICLASDYWSFTGRAALRVIGRWK